MSLGAVRWKPRRNHTMAKKIHTALLSWTKIGKADRCDDVKNIYLDRSAAGSLNSYVRRLVAWPSVRLRHAKHTASFELMQYSIAVFRSAQHHACFRKQVLTCAAAGLLRLGGMSGCSDMLPTCITLTPACRPLYSPTFENVYNNTIAKKCGGDSASCHSLEGMRGGLVLTDRTTAFTALTSGDTGRAVASDAACSGVIVRISSAGHAWSMPPEAPLGEAERCALEQWVQNGASGP